MNWYRAKTILIIFFICMNIFLLVNLIYTTNKANIVTPEVIASTVEVLKKNDIYIDADIIPQKTTSLSSFEMRNAFASKEDFAKMLCGNDALLGDDDTYTGINGSVAFDGDRFEFVPKSMKNNAAGKDLIDSAKLLLKDMGIDVSACDMSEYSDAGGSIVLFKNTADGYKVFDLYIKVYITTASDISRIEGVWFENISKSRTELSLKSVTSVLVDFILNSDRPTGRNDITALELGYLASYDDIYHEATVPIPVWQITLADGSTYCMDARD